MPHHHRHRHRRRPNPIDRHRTPKYNVRTFTRSLARALCLPQSFYVRVVSTMIFTFSYVCIVCFVLRVRNFRAISIEFYIKVIDSIESISVHIYISICVVWGSHTYDGGASYRCPNQTTIKRNGNGMSKKRRTAAEMWQSTEPTHTHTHQPIMMTRYRKSLSTFAWVRYHPLNCNYMYCIYIYKYV